jgi:hypothetical protein
MALPVGGEAGSSSKWTKWTDHQRAGRNTPMTAQQRPAPTQRGAGRLPPAGESGGGTEISPAARTLHPARQPRYTKRRLRPRTAAGRCHGGVSRPRAPRRLLNHELKELQRDAVLDVARGRRRSRRGRCPRPSRRRHRHTPRLARPGPPTARGEPTATKYCGVGWSA